MIWTKLIKLQYSNMITGIRNVQTQNSVMSISFVSWLYCEYQCYHLICRSSDSMFPAQDCSDSFLWEHMQVKYFIFSFFSLILFAVIKRVEIVSYPEVNQPGKKREQIS